MNFITTPFEGLIIIEPKIFRDHRGYFFESYNKEEFKKNGIPAEFMQDNQSLSNKGVLRGLHFQLPPFEQGKLIRVTEGAVLDICVDIRKSSSTFRKYFSIILNGTENKMLWVPPGFAHGFLTLEDETVFMYKCTNLYNKESEKGIRYNDPDLDIKWNEANPVLSDKDLELPLLKDLISLI